MSDSGNPSVYTAARVIQYVVLTLFAVLFILPFIWLWSSALKTPAEIMLDPFALPSDPQWGNLSKAWTTGQFSSYIGNSFLYCAIIVPIVLVFCSAAGYALGSLRVPGEKIIFPIFLLGIMIPIQAIMIPQFHQVRGLGLLGSVGGIVIPGVAVGLAFGVFLMRAFFRGLPKEIAQAARLDGATEWQVFWMVMLPMARSGLVTLAVFQFMISWNMFLIPLLYGQSEGLRPIATGILFFIGRFTMDRGMIAAGATLSTIPIIVVYLLLQRYVISGLTAGAVK
ncbi:MAG: carbohydrate ABC transporter permease [Marinosulfonomonas sp.]